MSATIGLPKAFTCGHCADFEKCYRESSGLVKSCGIHANYNEKLASKNIPACHEYKAGSV